MLLHLYTHARKHILILLTYTHNLASNNCIKKHEWYPGGPNALTFAKIHVFSSKHFCFFSIFHSIWQCEKNALKGDLKWNPRVAFCVVGRLNQRTSLRAPGKHLLQVQSLHRPNNNFYFSEQLQECWKEEACCTVLCHKSNWCVCWVTDLESFKIKAWLYSCKYSCLYLASIHCITFVNKAVLFCEHMLACMHFVNPLNL